MLLEKPLALTLAEADELLALSQRQEPKFAVGYSQRFNPKQAYAKQCVADGTLGTPVSALVSRHITRNLGKKIGGRIKLTPAAMEATHDSHRDIVLNRMDGGIAFPLSTMPGEQVGHVYAGPMAAETSHFLEAVALDRPVLVPAAEAREVMEVYLAADESAGTGRPVDLLPG